MRLSLSPSCAGPVTRHEKKSGLLLTDVKSGVCARGGGGDGDGDLIPRFSNPMPAVFGVVGMHTLPVRRLASGGLVHGVMQIGSSNIQALSVAKGPPGLGRGRCRYLG